MKAFPEISLFHNFVINITEVVPKQKTYVEFSIIYKKYLYRTVVVYFL